MEPLKKALFAKNVVEQIDNPTTKKTLSCEKHGRYEGYTMVTEARVIKSICPECLEEEKEADQKEIIKNCVMNLGKNIFARSCIPKRYQNKGMKTYHPTCEKAEVIKKILTGYIKNIDRAMEDGTSFLFIGKPGTGKTHLACAIAMNAISLGRTSTYISAADCVAKVKESWVHKSERSEDNMIEQFSRFDLLVLDEIGLGELTAKEKNILFRVINRRYEECLPTIGISKYNRAKLKTMMGEEFVSRIESGGGGTLEFMWDDYRSRGRIRV